MEEGLPAESRCCRTLQPLCPAAALALGFRLAPARAGWEGAAVPSWGHMGRRGQGQGLRDEDMLVPMPPP